MQTKTCLPLEELIADAVVSINAMRDIHNDDHVSFDPRLTRQKLFSQ